MEPQHWVDAAYDASWRGPGSADDRDGDATLREASEEIDAVDYQRIQPQLREILREVNARPCTPEAWAHYRDAGVRAVTRAWGADPFVWSEAEGEAEGGRGQLALDWEFFDALTPRQRARACSLVHLALTNAAVGLPDIAW
jgi:hypothetical protein